SEPKPLPSSVKGQLHALIGIQPGIAELVEAGTGGEPQTTAPISDRGDLPAADHVVQSARHVSAPRLAPAKGEIDNAVVTNAMRRHVRRVEIDELQPLVVAHIGLAPELNVFRHPPSATTGVYKHSA